MRNLILVLALILTACGSSTAPKSATITCTAAYRASVTQAIEREASITLADAKDEQAIAFADMILHAAYSTGQADNERALRLWVTDTAETTTFQSNLYQLDPAAGPQNQFRGGHGFTGLGYSYHPESRAELQYWCAAD